MTDNIEVLDDCLPGWCGAMVAAFSLRVRQSTGEEKEQAQADLAVATKLADAMPRIRAYRTASNPLREVLDRFGVANVKPLEWEEHPDGGEWWSVDHGDWGISEYDISPNPVGSYIRMRVRGHLLTEEFESIDEAKAAAQADYERRILSALEMPAGIEAAKQRIAEIGPGSSLIDNMSDEEFAADRSDENPNAGTPAPVAAYGVYLNDGRFMAIAESTEQDAIDQAEAHYETGSYHIRPLYLSTTPTPVSVRHENGERNKIINRASTDLESIINGHDPDVSILGNDVWDRLDRMAVEIEQLTTPAPVSEITEEMVDPSFPEALTDSEVRIWIASCNHEPARQTLRQLLAYRVRGVSTALTAAMGVE